MSMVEISLTVWHTHGNSTCTRMSMCMCTVDAMPTVHAMLVQERDGLDGSEGMVINQGSIGTGHGDNYLKGRMSETKAKLSGGYATEGSNPGLGGRGQVLFCYSHV